MLVCSETDGLTQGSKVFRKGEVFILNDKLVGEVKNRTDVQVEVWQKRIYGRRIFRRATEDEIIFAFKKKLIKLSDMDVKEREGILKRIQSTSERRTELTRQLLETTSDDEIETDQVLKPDKDLILKDSSVEEIPVVEEVCAVEEVHVKDSEGAVGEKETEIKFEDSIDDLLEGGKKKRGRIRA